MLSLACACEVNQELYEQWMTKGNFKNSIKMINNDLDLWHKYERLGYKTSKSSFRIWGHISVNEDVNMRFASFISMKVQPSLFK